MPGAAVPPAAPLAVRPSLPPELGLALPPPERERAYSPSSCIGGTYAPFVAAYGERSRQAREAAAAAGGVWQSRRYGPLPAHRLELCLPSRPAAAGAAPLLLFVHGGYWQELSAAQSLFAAPACVGRGAAFAALEYTLAPAASVADIVAECRTAMAWLGPHAASLGIDPGRVVVAGSSAGAHLAAMLSLPEPGTAGAACAAGAAGAPLRPRAAVLVSGVYWLEPLVGTGINDALGMDAPAAARASPGLQPLAGFPPALLAWGEIETAAFKAQSRCFGAALRAAASTCTELEVPGRNHFDVVLDLADPGSALGAWTLAALDAPR